MGYSKKMIISVLLFCVFLTACGRKEAQNDSTPDVTVSGAESYTKYADYESVKEEPAVTGQAGSSNDENSGERKNITNMKMNVQIGNVSFVADLEDNTATRELIEMMRKEPISIHMDDYSDFEKVGSLGRSLTTDNKQITTQPGDIVLYSGNQIVMFYGSNSWSYTRIGKIDDLSGWEDALGDGGVTAVFSLAE